VVVAVVVVVVVLLLLVVVLVCAGFWAAFVNAPFFSAFCLCLLPANNSCVRSSSYCSVFTACKQQLCETIKLLQCVYCLQTTAVCDHQVTVGMANLIMFFFVIFSCLSCHVLHYANSLLVVHYTVLYKICVSMTNWNHILKSSVLAFASENRMNFLIFGLSANCINTLGNSNIYKIQC
jgi:hypothetical protein